VTDRERVLALLHELQEADAEKGVLVDEAHDLLEHVRAMQGKAHGVKQTQARLPARRESATQDLDRARDELRAAQAALAEARAAVCSAAKGEERTAELFEVRARDRQSVAERRVAEADGEVKAVEVAGGRLEELTLKLQAEGRSLAEALRNRPRIAEEAGVQPAPGLDSLLEWAETARAALLVARSQAMAERDAVIRQANELGSVSLGEPLGSASVGVVARRVERALD
jgi:hypothetical protein